MNYTYFIIFVIISYLLGSINSGILIAKHFYGIDIREHGSQNAGATNTLRTLGTKAAASVFILDILKPVLMISIAKLLFPTYFEPIIGSYIWLGFFSILGQCYPIFFGFKGGKGAASTLGTLIAGFPIILPISAFIFLLVVFITKYVSLATLTAIGLTAFLVLYKYPTDILPYLCIVLLVYWKHIPNIQRLLNKTESKLSVGKKK